MSVIDELKTSFKTGSVLTRLIYVNVAVFLVIKLLDMISVLSGQTTLSTDVVNYLALPASPDLLASHPWAIITYMFLHQGFFHILFNMLWLYWFGKIFLDYLDQRKLLSLYLMGGIAGGLLYMIVYNTLPVFAGLVNGSVCLGASAAIMAIIVATAVYMPDLELYLMFFGRVKLKYLALITFFIVSIFDFSVNTGGKISHIGGAIMGLAYGYGIKNGRDLGAWLNKIIDFFVTLFKPRKKLKVTYKKPKTDIEYNTLKREHQNAIDHILDKISKGGYESLTKEEKELLFRESQKKN